MAEPCAGATPDSWVLLNKRVLQWTCKMIWCDEEENPEGWHEVTMVLDEVNLHTSVTDDQVRY